MPYRIDVDQPGPGAMGALIDLGALDVEQRGDALAALLPDRVSRADARAAAGGAVRVSTAEGRDDGSVWTLSPRPVQVGHLRFVPAHAGETPDALPSEARHSGAIRLADGPAFGTGLHPTTVLCLEALIEIVDAHAPASMLDVGTGSGILALAALHLGVPRATGVEIDVAALEVAREGGRLNAAGERLELLAGGPEAAEGRWPLIIANIRAGELMELVPALTRRLASRGRIVLSGIPASAGAQVTEAYERAGLVSLGAAERDGWVAPVLLASW